MLLNLFVTFYLTIFGLPPTLWAYFPNTILFVSFCFSIIFNIFFYWVSEYFGFVTFYRHTLLS
uniref:Uncharacterized protein n=1 Tax=Bird gammacoronavirus AnasCN24 TaxID=3237959 RepID=A0AB39AER0_9GAMC